ncbi:MAG TPA: isochorismatase family cysteine hydrolase [bacterium]|jgi:nicotinamidase-related amidase|nr:isochorismatase family cysteine hydrolase [bacterium]
MKLDPKTTAVLTLDIQEGLLGSVPGADLILPNAAKVVETARKGGFHLFHVGIGFEPGYPEISQKNKRFAAVKERGVFVKGSDTAKFHSSVYKTGDTVIYKHRYGAFTGNALEMILRAQGIETLVFFGITTSGIVLSTQRSAFDMDFNCVIVKDACVDRDEEVHRVLMEKVFTVQGTVISSADFEA